MEPQNHQPDRRAQDVDAAADRRYRDLIRSVHQEWDALEARGDSSVQLSQRAISSINEAVRADARHGAQVTMPPTEAGPFTITESALRALVRSAVDSVPDALALRSSFEHVEDQNDGVRVRGLPTRVRLQISARLGNQDLPGLAELVRHAVRSAFRSNLAVSDLIVDIRIEDLHEHTD